MINIWRLVIAYQVAKSGQWEKTQSNGTVTRYWVGAGIVSEGGTSAVSIIIGPLALWFFIKEKTGGEK